MPGDLAIPDSVSLTPHTAVQGLPPLHTRSRWGTLGKGILVILGYPLRAKRERGTWGLFMEEKLGSKTEKGTPRTGTLCDRPGGVHPMAVASW